MESVTVRLDRLPLSRFHWRVSLVGGVGSSLRSVGIGMLTFVLASLVDEWGLSPSEVGAVGSASIAGMVLGIALVGALADHFGRKTMFQVSLLVFALGSLLSALAWDNNSLLVIRFLTGIGLGGGSPVVITLISELSPSRYRGRLLLLLESFWAIGGTLAGIIAFIVIPRWGWRTAFVFGALSGLYFFVVAKWLPESPRFLLSRGRTAEANQITRQAEVACGIAGEDDLCSSEPAGRAPERRSRVGLRELWSRPYIKRTICIWVLWFTVGYVYYGVFVWLPSLLKASGMTLSHSFEYSIIILMAQLPGCLTAAALVDRIGRKRTLVPFMILAGIATYLFGIARTAESILLWGCLIAFFNLGAWGIMTAFGSELYPTRLRSTGLGWASAFGRVGGIIAPIVTGMVLGQWSSNYELLFTLFAVMSFVGGLVVALLGEETSGRSLEELAA
ncbi:MAG: MFS transporter [Chloroflexi bacterium]|nr:MFS transporter [Chloroflexota bacterium]